MMIDENEAQPSQKPGSEKTLDYSNPDVRAAAGLKRITAYVPDSGPPKPKKKPATAAKALERERNAAKGIRDVNCPCPDRDRDAIKAAAALARSGVRIPHPDSLVQALTTRVRTSQIAMGIMLCAGVAIGWALSHLY